MNVNNLRYNIIILIINILINYMTIDMKKIDKTTNV